MHINFHILSYLLYYRPRGKVIFSVILFTGSLPPSSGQRPPSGQRSPTGQRPPSRQRFPSGQRPICEQRPPHNRDPSPGQRPSYGQRFPSGQRPLCEQRPSHNRDPSLWTETPPSGESPLPLERTWVQTGSDIMHPLELTSSDCC